MAGYLHVYINPLSLLYKRFDGEVAATKTVKLFPCSFMVCACMLLGVSQGYKSGCEEFVVWL